MAGLGMGVVSVVDGDCDNSGDELTAGLVMVVVVVSVVDGDCAVRLEHATNPLLRKRAAIANPPHIFGENVAGFAILLRFSTAACSGRVPRPWKQDKTGAALPTMEDLARL